MQSDMTTILKQDKGLRSLKHKQIREISICENEFNPRKTANYSN